MAAADYKTEQKKKEREREKRREERQERRAQKRDRNIHLQYRRDASPLHLRYTWRITQVFHHALHKRLSERPISSLVESFDWQEETNWMTGTMVFREPQNVEGQEAKISDGDLIRVECKIGSRWYHIFQMRVSLPDESVGEGMMSVQLTEDLALADQGTDDWDFPKKKHGPHKEGWKAHEIALRVFKRLRIKVGQIAEAKIDQTINERDKSGLGVVIAAYTEERKQTGRRFVFRWERGKVNIYPLRRSPFLYALRQQIISASVTVDRGPEFFTAVTMVGNVEAQGKKGAGDDEDDKDEDKKGATQEALEVLVVDEKAVRRYGYIHVRKKVDNNAKSKADLRERGERMIANNIARKTLEKITLSHTGIPFIRRGDAVEVNLPRYGFTNQKRRPVDIYQGGHKDILFVTTIRHSVVAGDYTMDLEFDIADPVAEMKEDVREARDKKRREEKRKERKDS